MIAASDHGQISSSGQIDLANLISTQGHQTSRAAERRLNGAAVSLTGGNMGEIRVLTGDVARRDAIAAWLREQPFLGMLFSPARNDVEGEVPGSFALSLVGLDHARQPDLVYVLQSSEILDPFGYPGLGLITGGVPVGGGMHGGLNRYELNTVLIARGGTLFEGAPNPAPAGIVDIAPTILAFLGIEPPASIRGRSLLRALQEEPTWRSYETGVNGFGQMLQVAECGRSRRVLAGARTDLGSNR